MLRIAASHAARWLVVGFLAASTLALTPAAQARGPWWITDDGGANAASGSVVALADLPRQGQETYRLILDGGPFPHDKDGSVFGNRERQLPVMKRGYYREYTVNTPGARDRGARRIVCGGKPPRAPEACWYTIDHYSSFRRIVP